MFGGGLFSRMKKQDDLIKAIKANDVIMVSEILHDRDSDPTLDDNEALKLAVKRGSIPILEVLLKDWDILSTMSWSETIKLANTTALKTYLGRVKAQRDIMMKHNRM
jgi:hypothetical protein